MTHSQKFQSLIIWIIIDYQELIVTSFNHLLFVNVNDKWIALYSSPYFWHFRKNEEYEFFPIPFFIIIKVPKIGKKIISNSFIICISK